MSLPVAIRLFAQLNDLYHIEAQIEPALPDTYVLPRIATMLRNARRALGEGSVHLCIPGDFLSPSCLSKQFAGAQMVDVLNALGTRCVCFGNHEFDEGLDAEQLLARVNESMFMWLGTNLVFADKRLKHHKRLSTVLTLPLSNNSNLGVLGFTYAGTFGDTAVAVDPIEIAKLKFQLQDASMGLLSAMGAKARAYLALTHMTIDQDDKLARSTDRLLLLMGGHDHE